MITNRRRHNQFIDFSGFEQGVRQPMDVDCLIEVRGSCILIEFKYRNAAVPYGQRLSLESIVDGLEASGRNALAIVAEHYVDDVRQDVDGSRARVREVYYSRKWMSVNDYHTCGEMTKKFLDYAEAKKWRM